MSGKLPHFDVAVIGAGINGAGIARDAAMRGLRVAVFDKDDMCTGCSWISSRLIHGGLRYLEYAEIPLVYESLRERRNLLVTAPHLVAPLRICLPIFRNARRGPLLIRLGMLAYDILSIRKSLPNHEMLDSDEICEQEPGLRSDGLRAAARYYDAQVTFAERLVLENLLSAHASGASVHLHSEVTAIRVGEGAVQSLAYTDRIDNSRHEITVDTVVNAAGPWVDEVLDVTPVPVTRHIGGTKGSHIIVDAFDGAPRDAFYVEAAADGRPFFIIPWNQQYLIGTTDIRYDGDLDSVRASDAEVDYLLAETNRVFPRANLSKSSINYAYAGIRPLPFQDKGPESAITRKHIIKVNKNVAEGLISIIGGKLTTYRSLAEQTVDRIAGLKHLKLPECHTGDTALPGAQRLENAAQQLRGVPSLSEAGVDRLLSVYGGRAADICALARSDTELAKTLDPDGKVPAAEIVFAVRNEFARTLIDIVFRRCMLGLDNDQGRPLYASIAAVAAGEFGWDAAEKSRQIDDLVQFSDSLRVS